MTSFRGKSTLAALIAMLTLSAVSHAAWNNVFQVCCHRDQVSVSNFASDCCDPCPQPQCTTRYVQRCYYEPVTTYKRKTWYEPVPRYRTSHYYEPCTTPRHSCYYDPCTCRYRQVATPVTSYRLRSRCNAVTSYLQRCQLVPVTSYRQRTYYQAITECCDPCSTRRAPSVQQGPVTTEPPPVTKPRVEEGNGQTPRIKEESSNNGGASRFPPVRRGEPAYRPIPRRADLKLDRTVSLADYNVEGTVTDRERYPQGRARLLFVSADRQGVQRSITADENGKFQAQLASGRWLIYVRDSRTGRPIYQTRLDVEDRGFRRVSLTSR